MDELSEEEKLIVSRARKVQRFCRSPFRGPNNLRALAGRYVPLSETIQGFKEIIEGKHDDIPESYFLNAGNIDDVLASASKVGQVRKWQINYLNWKLFPRTEFLQGAGVYGGNVHDREGEIGVYAGHIPMTNILKPGILHIVEAGGQDKYAAVHDGFIEILPDKITVLAGIAEWPEEIDINRANEAKIRAERRLAENAQDLDAARGQAGSWQGQDTA